MKWVFAEWEDKSLVPAKIFSNSLKISGLLCYGIWKPVETRKEELAFFMFCLSYKNMG